MRIKHLVAAAVVSGLLVGGMLMGADPATGPASAPASAPAGLAPVLAQTITRKDLPATQPVVEWNAKWNSVLASATSLARLDNWVYVMSSPNGYYLRFQRAPAAAKLQLVEAIEMHRHTEGSWGGLNVRRMPDGSGILYADYGTEQKPMEGSLRWFRIDAKTGALTLLGTLEKGWPFPRMPGPYGYPGQAWNPDRSRLYRAFVENITWVSFKEDGTPQEGGSAKMQNRSDGGGRPHPSAAFSPDGKQFYVLAQRAKPIEGVTWVLDQYDVDAKTGIPTFAASLDMPGADGTLEFLDVPPDGRHVYVIVGGASGQLVLTLRRDADKGALTPAGRKDDAKFKGLGGASWERGMLRFNADGKSGYFTTKGWANSASLWPFTREAATGELTIFPAVKGAGRIFDLDPVAGDLIWGFDSLTVYKTPAAPPAGATSK